VDEFTWSVVLPKALLLKVGFVIFCKIALSKLVVYGIGFILELKSFFLAASNKRRNRLLRL